MTDQTAEICEDAAGYLINHIFLPPKLPGADDYEPKHEKYLLDLLFEALSAYKSRMPVDHDNAIAFITSMVDRTRDIHDSHGHVNSSKLKSTLLELCDEGESTCAS